jgi:tetratricopeptide (TPR) repeat protein
MTYPPEGVAPPLPDVSAERLGTLFPNALGDYLDERVPDPEHKVATIGFARFSGTDVMLAVDGPAAVAEALHATLSVFEDALVAEGVTLLATDLDSDGGKLFMGSGVPFSSEDDEGRMLRAMRRVLDAGTPLPVQIGVNRGHVFAAEVGALERAAYSAMGDTTNTAARIMSKAPHGVMYAHPTVLEQSRTLFATEPAGPFPMKGKAIPVLVHAVGEELGTREAAARAVLPLVGRDVELATMRAALDRALDGEGDVITVAATTGLGKSRIIAEAMHDREATIVHVRAEPYGMTSPYRMLRDPVRQAFGVERDEPEVMTSALLAAFERLLPELLPLAPLLEDVVNIPIPSTPEAAAIEPQYRPDRIADIVLRLVERGVRGPFVLQVEEAHWADSASIAVLRRIADSVDGRPWAVVVARRTDGEGFDPSGGTRVELGPLPEDVMRRLVVGATEAAPLRPHEIDGIVARAGGNPLYVEELVRLFREVGSIDAMPESLHAALDAQIDALDPHARRVLRYASVLGRSFRREVLDETLRSDELIVDDATVSRLRGFLEADGEARMRFRTGMIRDAAYDGLAYRLRGKLHLSAGAAVERLSNDVEADSDTLSLHFWRGGDDQRTWRYARLAGARAARAYANIDAATQYERALSAARSLADVTDEQRRELWLGLGEVRARAGLFESAVDALDRAIRLAGDDHGVTSKLLDRRARTRMEQGSYVAALRDITKAEKLFVGDESLEARRARTRLRSMRASIRQEQQRFKDALKVARVVVTEAREVGEADALETALGALDAVAFALGDTSVGENTREALESARAHDRLSRAALLGSNLAAFAFYTGQWDLAVGYLVEARTTYLSAGDVVGAALAGLSLGELYVDRNQRDDADEVLAESVRILRTAGLNAQKAYGVIHQARSLLARGEVDKAQSLAEIAEGELLGLALPVFAAEATLVRAEALTVGGHPGRALALLPGADEPVQGEYAALAPRFPLERARALIERGRPDDAAVEVSAGLALAREHALPYEEARLLALEAAVAAARGDDATQDRAASEAAAILARLGVLDES